MKIETVANTLAAWLLCMISNHLSGPWAAPIITGAGLWLYLLINERV